MVLCFVIIRLYAWIVHSVNTGRYPEQQHVPKLDFQDMYLYRKTTMLWDVNNKTYVFVYRVAEPEVASEVMGSRTGMDR